MGEAAKTLFGFLFKYRPILFERGDLSLSVPWVAYVAVVASLTLAVAFLLRYRGLGGDLRPAERWILVGVRTAILALVLLVLLRPELLVSTVVPRRNYVGILIDDSRSMRIDDRDGSSRADLVDELFGPETGDIPARLADRFFLRQYGFTGTVERVEGAEDLTFQGTRTDLAAALTRARQEMAGLSLSGLVIVTDGADNAGGTLEDELLALRSASVPVYTVGLGDEELRPDLEILRVEVPSRVLRGSTLVADVLVAQRGFDSERARVDIEDDGRIIGSEEFDLPDDGETAVVRVQFTAEEPGARDLTFRIEPREGEALEENNVRETIMQVGVEPQKILYLEGEPRFEVKFMRRAVENDENIQLLVLQRSAENKYLRLGVDDADELVGGFPKTREELFQYRGLILGSVEASFFTHDQLAMIADFVGQRGGGLLVLGGRRALAEGGFIGTPLEDVLPVRLEAGNDTPEGSVRYDQLTVALTPAGRRHPALRLSGNAEESAERWSSLPPLGTRNQVERVKPGAVTLLTGAVEGESDDRVVLAFQRFGRGLSIAFPVEDSWMWQMHADIPLDDMTHETLWRQLMRWLVSDGPGRVRVRTSESRVSPGESIEIVAEVEDERFLRVNGIRVGATVVSPSGIPQDVPLEWTIERDGEYAAGFIPDEEGLYEIRVEAEGDDGVVVKGTGHLIVGPSRREYFDAGMRASLLRRIADETGGRFYTPRTVESLPEDIQYTESGDTVVESNDLWDAPIVFFLLVGLAGFEWGFRRKRGLV